MSFKIGICFHSPKLIYSNMLKIVYIFTALFYVVEPSAFLSAMKQFENEFESEYILGLSSKKQPVSIAFQWRPSKMTISQTQLKSKLLALIIPFATSWSSKYFPNTFWLIANFIPKNAKKYVATQPRLPISKNIWC